MLPSNSRCTKTSSETNSIRGVWSKKLGSAWTWGSFFWYFLIRHRKTLRVCCKTLEGLNSLSNLWWHFTRLASYRVGHLGKQDFTANVMLLCKWLWVFSCYSFQEVNICHGLVSAFSLSCSHIVYCQLCTSIHYFFMYTTEQQSQHSRQRKVCQVLDSHFLLTKRNELLDPPCVSKNLFPWLPKSEHKL